MSAIRRCELPDGALLRRYAASGTYADCYVAEIARTVSHAEFVEAFYTSAVFKLERFVLRLLASYPSTDAQAKQLAQGELGSFAAWTVEGRAPNQLLLRAGRTRSWLMVSPTHSGGAPNTQLFFGSAVVPAHNAAAGRRRLGLVFRALLGFHKLYSRVLLGAARSRLSR
jgi:hypothetical protein